MTLYMEVTTDKYELPVVVAGSRKELATICGVKPNSIDKLMHLYRTGKINTCRYRKVECEDE